MSLIKKAIKRREERKGKNGAEKREDDEEGKPNKRTMREEEAGKKEGRKIIEFFSFFSGI